MTQTMDLEKMGLIPMNENEIIEIDGGGFLANALAIAGALIGFLVAGPIGAGIGGIGGGIIGTILE